MEDDFCRSLVRTRVNQVVSTAKGYWIISVRILDQLRYEQYLEVALDAIDRSGGDMIIRSSAGVAAAGDPKPRIVVVEFASLSDARDAFQTIAHQAAMLMYQQIADYDVLIVEGLDCPQ